MIGVASRCSVKDHQSQCQWRLSGPVSGSQSGCSVTDSVAGGHWGHSGRWLALLTLTVAVLHDNAAVSERPGCADCISLCKSQSVSLVSDCDLRPGRTDIALCGWLTGLNANRTDTQPGAATDTQWLISANNTVNRGPVLPHSLPDLSNDLNRPVLPHWPQ